MCSKIYNLKSNGVELYWKLLVDVEGTKLKKCKIKNQRGLAEEVTFFLFLLGYQCNVCERDQ